MSGSFDRISASSRTAGFALLVAATLAALWKVLRMLFGFALEPEQ